MELEIGHPLVSLSVPEKSHGGATQQNLGKGEVHITRMFETEWDTPRPSPRKVGS